MSMQKIYLLSLVFNLLLLFKVEAQNNAALIKDITSAKNDAQKVSALNKLASIIKFSNPDSSILLSSEALSIAIPSNYQFGICVANLNLSNAYSSKANYEISLSYSQKAMALAQVIKNDSLLSSSLLSIANYYFNNSSYDKSIEYALKALTMVESSNDKIGIYKAKTILAQVYQLKNDLPQAEKLLEEIKKEANEKIDIKFMLNNYHTLANVYGMQEKYAKALSIDREGIVLSEKNNLSFFSSQFFDNMANCYLYKKVFDSALYFFNKSLVIDSMFDNKKQMSDTYLNLGLLYKSKSTYNLAVQKLLHSIELAEASGYKQGKYEAYQLLSEIYTLQNKSNFALVALKNAYTTKDSIFNEKSEAKIAELQTVYDTQKKETQIQLQEATITKKNYFIWSIAAVLLLLSVAAFSIFKKRQSQNKLVLQTEIMHQQNIATKAILNAEENERSRIAAELHDGIGQMMSVAKMNLSSFENELTFSSEKQKTKFDTIVHLVDESCKEVRQVSHQMMPNALLKKGLTNAVREFISNIDEQIIKISMHTEGLNKSLDSNTEAVLYRIIQECVNNVLKHAEANHLDIAILKDGGFINITIEDNGKGFDSNDMQNVEGIGLKNIASRVQFLNGAIEYSSKINAGTLVAIHIPLNTKYA